MLTLTARHGADDGEGFVAGDDLFGQRFVRRFVGPIFFASVGADGKPCAAGTQFSGNPSGQETRNHHGPGSQRRNAGTAGNEFRLRCEFFHCDHRRD